MIRPARLEDAPAIAAIHVAAWRSAYANLLPTPYLASMSLERHTAQHRAAIAAGRTLLVATAGDRPELPVVGFASAGRPRTPGLAEGEVETLYVQDDAREQGHGRDLLQAAATTLHQAGCTSLFLWVLADNPSRWFYERLGGRPAAQSMTEVARQPFKQTAYVWSPITLLLKTSATP